MNMIEVVQVIPQNNYDLIVYFDDGKIVKYNVGHLVGKGVFKVLGDIEFYMSRCTVMNHTVAWDISGDYDQTKCLDLAPEVIYEDGMTISDPLKKIA